jgi:O-antigen chain-terminating methyltransferase
VSDQFYRAFEDRYRGSRDTVKARLTRYLGFVEPVARRHPGASALDLGCGRGEWLEVLAGTRLQPLGVDLDDEMLDVARALGLPVAQADVLEYLESVPADSQAVVTAFHLVEHLPFTAVRHIVAESLRVLKPGGLLIMETPNPENIAVATCGFYLDPTHHHPIPPRLLYFVAEYHGFHRVKVVRLQESIELLQREVPTLCEVLQGASPDYAIVAQKKADTAVLADTEKQFAADYGLTLETLAARYDQGMQAKVREAEDHVALARREIDALVGSTSWKVTKPLRWLTGTIRALVKKG